MSLYLLLPLISLAAVCAVMTLVWVWGTSIHNYGVVDVFWAFNFAVIAVLIWLLADGNETRKILVCGLALLWSLRLGAYLSVRVLGHLNEEEGRYKQLRKEWHANRNLKFYAFFQMQAISNVLLSTPYFLAALNRSGEITLLEYVSAVLWLLSIAGEALADWQLSRFRKKASNKGKVCDTGLWNYSRHPNYFFQLMLQVSVFLFALSSEYGWIALVCPLSIGYLLFKVTGIPMTEEQSIRSKGEAYKKYQRTTSGFIPWFKKKAS